MTVKKKNAPKVKKYFIDDQAVSETLYKSVQIMIGNAIEAEEEKTKESFVAGLMCGIFLMGAIAIFIVVIG